MMVLAVLEDGPIRFNTIKRRLEGVTPKALTMCLRRLERNGLLSRRSGLLRGGFAAIAAGRSFVTNG